MTYNHNALRSLHHQPLPSTDTLSTDHSPQTHSQFGHLSELIVTQLRNVEVQPLLLLLALPTQNHTHTHTHNDG